MSRGEEFYADYLLEDGRWVWEDAEPQSDYPAFVEEFCERAQQWIVDNAEELTLGDADLLYAMFRSADREEIVLDGIYHAPHVADCLRDNVQDWRRRSE